jgi:hypothetical protein
VDGDGEFFSNRSRCEGGEKEVIQLHRDG